MAVIDVISPCVTFANNDESYRSYNYVKGNEEELHTVDYILHFTPIEEVEAPEGQFEDISLFDGSTLRLETLGDDHDPGNAVAALAAIHEAEKMTSTSLGLLYYDSEMKTADEALGLTDTPLVDLTEEELRPSKKALDELNQSFRA